VERVRAGTRNCQSSQAPARPTSWPALRTLAIFSIDLPFLRGRDRCCRGPAGTSLPLAGRTSLPWAHPTRPPVAEGRSGLARGDPAGCGQAAWRPRPPALGGAQRGWAPRSAGRDKSPGNSPAATADRRPTAKKVRKLPAQEEHPRSRCSSRAGVQVPHGAARDEHRRARCSSCMMSIRRGGAHPGRLRVAPADRPRMSICSPDAHPEQVVFGPF